jgi:hypothetical protein
MDNRDEHCAKTPDSIWESFEGDSKITSRREVQNRKHLESMISTELGM